MKRGRAKRIATKEELAAKEAQTVVKRSTNKIVNKVSKKPELIPEDLRNEIDAYLSAEDHFKETKQKLERAKTFLADYLYKGLPEDGAGFHDDIVELLRLREENKQELISFESAEKRKKGVQEAFGNLAVDEKKFDLLKQFLKQQGLSLDNLEGTSSNEEKE